MSATGGNVKLELTETIVIALRGITTVLVIYSFGILLTGYFKKIDQKGVSALSSLVASLFIPCFYVSRLGKSFTVELIAELWMVPLVYLSIVAANGVATYILILPIARCNKEQRVWFALGQFFANVLALPLLVVPSICSQIQFETDLLTGSNETKTLSETECVERGEVFLIIATLLSQFVYWLLVFPFVYHFGTKVTNAEEKLDTNGVVLLRRALSAPPTCETNSRMGDDLALMDKTGGDVEQQQQQQDTEGEAKVLDDSSDASVVKKKTYVWERLKRWVMAKWRSHHVFEILRTTLLKGAVCSQIVGCVVGLWPALSFALFDPSGAIQPIGKAVSATASGFAPIVNLALSATLGLQSREITMRQFSSARDELGVHRQTYVVFVLGRMVLLPVFNFLLLYLLQDMFLPKDQLLRLALYSTVATPAANLHIVVASILGDYTGARFLAKGSFFQFCIGILTYTLFLFLAVVLSTL